MERIRLASLSDMSFTTGVLTIILLILPTKSSLLIATFGQTNDAEHYLQTKLVFFNLFYPLNDECYKKYQYVPKEKL